MLHFLEEEKMVSLDDGELFRDTFANTKRFQTAIVKKCKSRQN